MAEIRDRILISKKKKADEDPSWSEKPFIQILFEIIDQAENSAQRPWLIDVESGDYLKTDQLQRKALVAAKRLASLGLKRGDVVHVTLPNCLDFHATVFGIWLLGCIASLSDPSLAENVMKQQILDTKAALVVCNDYTLDKSQKVATSCGLKIISATNLFLNYGTEPNVKPGTEYFHLLHDISGVMVIFWSSGTTGRPKVELK